MLSLVPLQLGRQLEASGAGTALSALSYGDRRAGNVVTALPVGGVTGPQEDGL